MNVFRFRSDVGIDFGYFRPGPQRSYRDVAPMCGPPCPWGPQLKRVYPGEMQFTGGPVGDFMTAIDWAVAKRNVADELASEFQGIKVETVLIAPPKKGSAAKYSGPEMVELRMTLQIPFNPERSTLELVESCEKCGRSNYRFVGIEEPPHEEKIGDRWEMVELRPRKPHMGVILPRSVIGTYDFFDYGNGFNMCTESAKSYIESRGWTNIWFCEFGEIVNE